MSGSGVDFAQALINTQFSAEDRVSSTVLNVSHSLEEMRLESATLGSETRGVIHHTKIVGAAGVIAEDGITIDAPKFVYPSVLVTGSAGSDGQRNVPTWVSHGE